MKYEYGVIIVLAFLFSGLIIAEIRSTNIVDSLIFEQSLQNPTINLCNKYFSDVEYQNCGYLEGELKCQQTCKWNFKLTSMWILITFLVIWFLFREIQTRNKSR